MASSDMFLSNVLVAEDSPVILMHLCMMLQDIGAGAIHPVSTVPEALAALSEERFDLAILDVQLGSENGLIIADRCTADDIPVIVATGFGDALQPAISPREVLLSKPYTRADLERAIATVRARLANGPPS